MNNLLSFLTITILTTRIFGQDVPKQNSSDFLPKGYFVFEKINGDLNHDGIEDCVLIIKGTDRSAIVETDEYPGKSDRNRRGIIVLLNKKSHYEPVVRNYNCFSSENEDGGIYYPPELSVEIDQGNLYIQYFHGRYGHWLYTFRYLNSDFELIDYNLTANHGPVTQYIISINFLTKKKCIKNNINEDKEHSLEEDVFVENWHEIKIERPVQLSEIKNFDELDMSIY